MTVFQIIAIVFFALAFIGAVISVILFFNLEITRVIGDLSGLTAKKQIEQIRSQTTNISYGSYSKKTSANRSHVAPIENIFDDSSISDSEAKAQAHSGKRLGNRRNSAPAAAQINSAPSDFKAQPTNGTASLDSLNATDALLQGRTDNLKRRKKKNASEAETDVLSSDEAMTDKLSDDSETPTDILDDNAPTDVLVDSTEAPTDVLNENVEEYIPESSTEAPTGVLSQDAEYDFESEEPTEASTGVLSQDTDDYASDETEGETGVLSDDYDGGTAVLSDDAEGTTVLSDNTEQSSISFNIISDETVVNTDEEIN